MQAEEKDGYMGNLSQFLQRQNSTLQAELLELLNRLRIEFNYCFYCGCQYESADALISGCPGVEEEDH